METIKQSNFQSFAEVYPYYLQEHGNPTCRRPHFFCTLGLFGVLAGVFMRGNLWGLLLLPVGGECCAWVGPYGFEKNRPATFKHPWYSLAGDFVMFKDILIGRIEW